MWNVVLSKKPFLTSHQSCCFLHVSKVFFLSQYHKRSLFKKKKSSVSRTQELCSCALPQFLNVVFCSPSAFVCSFWSAFQRHRCVVLNPNPVFDFVCLKQAKVKAKIVCNCFTCIYLNPRCLLRRSTWPTARKTKNSSKKKNRGG